MAVGSDFVRLFADDTALIMHDTNLIIWLMIPKNSLICIIGCTQ